MPDLAVKISNDLELHDLIDHSTHTDEIMEAACEVAKNSGMTGSNVYTFALGYLANQIADANK